MLTRFATVCLAVVLLVAPSWMTQGAAFADGPCQVQDQNGNCLVQGEVPGVDGGGGSSTPVQPPPGGGEPVACTNSRGEVVPCSSQKGWFEQGSDCYYKLADPQPPAGSPVWAGHAPGDGAIYVRWCGAATGFDRNAGAVWMANTPAGAPPVDPAALAQQLIAELTLKPPVVRLAPPSGTEGLIGLPVWMWSEQSQDVTGPVGDSMTAGAVTVSLWATVTKVVWDMGDGNSVACAGPGTPYTSSAGSSASPDCGHVYELPSRDQPNGVYTVTATSTWTIAWQGGGQSGQQTLELTSEPAELAIRELYVLNSSD